MLFNREELLRGKHVTRFYGEEEALYLAPPFSIAHNFLPQEFEAKMGEYTIPRPFVATMGNVHLCGPAGVGITADGNIILDTGYSGRLDVLERNMPYLTWAVDIKDKIEPVFVDRAVSMIGVWCENYFHWNTEFLPRLQGLEGLYGKPKVLVGSNPPNFVVDSLSMLGYTAVKTEAPHVVVKELLVPTFRRHEGRTSPSGVRWVRDKMTAECTEKPDNPKRIYISRNKAKERRVLNEEELMDALEPLGFKRIYTEELAYANQVSIMRDAEIVIAPHGAGVTNAIFAEDPTVIELFGSYLNPCYYALFASLGWDYGMMLCEPMGDDMVVDVGALVDFLDVP